MRFTSPPNLKDFKKSVWKMVRRVPRGRVATYGQIALLLAPPAAVAQESYRAFGARWVGGAMASCPDDVPWQRVINSQGRISQRPGADKQRRLLEEEGVVFVEDRVDLALYGWNGLGEGKSN